MSKELQSIHENQDLKMMVDGKDLHDLVIVDTSAMKANSQSRLDVYFYNWACTLSMLGAIAIEQYLLDGGVLGDALNNAIGCYSNSCNKFRLAMKYHGNYYKFSIIIYLN